MEVRYWASKISGCNFEGIRDRRRFQYGECRDECVCGRHWKLGDGWIKELQFYKYLGIEFNKNCNFAEFKVRIANKARRNRVMIGLMNKMNGSLSVKANVNLWESTIRAGLEYGAEVWGAMGEWEEAEVIQRETGRRILKCNGKTANPAVRRTRVVEVKHTEILFDVKILGRFSVYERYKNR